jgi:hypothetical protein
VVRGRSHAGAIWVAWRGGYEKLGARTPITFPSTAARRSGSGTAANRMICGRHRPVAIPLEGLAPSPYRLSSASGIAAVGAAPLRFGEIRRP